MSLSITHALAYFSLKSPTMTALHSKVSSYASPYPHMMELTKKLTIDKRSSLFHRCPLLLKILWPQFKNVCYKLEYLYLAIVSGMV